MITKGLYHCILNDRLESLYKNKQIKPKSENDFLTNITVGHLSGAC